MLLVRVVCMFGTHQLHAAATTFQRLWRGWRGRVKAWKRRSLLSNLAPQRLRARIHTAVHGVQRLFRGFVTRGWYSTASIHTRVSCLQLLWRFRSAKRQMAKRRRRHLAATAIRAGWVGHKTRRHTAPALAAYRHMLRCVVAMQARARMASEMRRLPRRKDAAQRRGEVSCFVAARSSELHGAREAQIAVASVRGSWSDADLGPCAVAVEHVGNAAMAEAATALSQRAQRRKGRQQEIARLELAVSRPGVGREFALKRLQKLQSNASSSDSNDPGWLLYTLQCRVRMHEDVDGGDVGPTGITQVGAVPATGTSTVVGRVCVSACVSVCVCVRVHVSTCL